MTWMTPFDACTSGVITLALFTKTDAPSTLIATLAPLTVFAEVSLTTSLGGNVAGDHVVEQDSLQLGRVGGERVERRLRHLGKRRVGRGEHRERARTFERFDETGSPEERGERLETAVVDGRRDDVGLAGGRTSRHGRASTAATATNAVARMSMIFRMIRAPS